MPERQYDIGQRFNVHFIWQLPDGGDVIRAVFEAEVLAVIEKAMKYLVRLDHFVAGRQESPEGSKIRPKGEIDFDYWPYVAGLEGQKVTLAWEVDDGRPVYLRLATLTGEHDFFRRFNR